MRVLLISHTCQSQTEGQPKAERLALCEGLELCVLTPDRWLHYGKWRSSESSPNPGYRFEAGKVAWPWAGPAQFYLHWYPQLSKLIEEFQPDIIDLWEEPWGLISVQVCQLRNRCFPKVKILSETEQNLDKRLPFPFESFRRYTLNNTDFAVGRNQESLNVLRSKGYSKATQVVPNAVDAKLFTSLDRKMCRQKLPFDGFVLGYVGRLVEEKGLLDMIEALPFCPEDVNLIFIGEGSFKAQMERRACELGKRRQIHFLPAQPLKALPEFMNAFDALVLASRTTPRWKEQFGRVIIEAHACGVPVIGSDSGAIPEVIGKGGLIVPERNPEALAAAIRQLYHDADLRSRLGAQGRLQVEEKYTWECVAQQMHQIYQEMIQ